MEMYLKVARPLHVLIVETDEDIRELLETLFVSQGCTVSCASGPFEALELAKSNVPDAIFTELIFPDINGFELCRRLRAMPEIATKFIVALTGFTATGVEETILDAGFDRYLLKPVNLQFLLSLLETMKKL
ncbi:response regulator [Massilia brevitalea]|uniref:response regulator n=1 Tax=Massilia brevitalea TaxID=442526 RepID=UPI002738419E|nr:response regulator [Massilia brevitalea]